ncbi:MAG: amidohydrolase [Bacteroidota bacterium]
MKLTAHLALFLFYIFCCISCIQKKQADLLITNATIYTVDSNFTIVQAMVINKGKIVATGSETELKSKFITGETIDAKGKFIYPGFIDAHCHFLAYGMGLNECDLTGTTSWDNVIEKLILFEKTHKEGWLIGRGWDQNDWTDKTYPVNDTLNLLFPGRPVLLSRVDGHAAIANNKALTLSGLNMLTNTPGGEIVKSGNKLTGILVDNAVGLVEKFIPKASIKQLTQGLLDAESNCFAAGLTSVQDCGLDVSDVLLIDSLNKTNGLQMRMFAMLSDKQQNYNWAFSHGKIKTEKLHVSSFKLYADGALGSRGACLLEPYSDMQKHRGFLLSNPAYYDSILPVIAAKGWQACTHAIGDSANRLILKIYNKVLQRQSDARWRIEHAQVINENDFDLFRDNAIIPSVQPTHATSDMYWAKDRLGDKRVKGAYAYQQLLKQNGWLPLGTDFPVEKINPLHTFYAATVRKDASGIPGNGFQAENALTREQAIKGMTIWAAKAAFEEKEKGSIEAGKFADFVMTDKDLMKIADNELLQANILMTVLGGKIVFERK